LNAALEQEGLTLKEWFLKNAHKLLYDDRQATCSRFYGEAASAPVYERKVGYLKMGDTVTGEKR
jgi:hypothetical protein